VQEILTDPSYKGQFVCFTHVHIGNTGINFGAHPVAPHPSLCNRAIVAERCSSTLTGSTAVDEEPADELHRSIARVEALCVCIATEDTESAQTHLGGVIVRDLSCVVSNYRSKMSLDEYLKEQVGIQM